MTAPAALDERALKTNALPPVVDGDKDSKGRILIIAGSREVPGAALLAARAAMRAGAGKLKIATVESIAPQVAVAMPEAMVVGLPEHRDGGFAGSAVARIETLAAEADAIVAGPGMSPGNICQRISDVLLAAPASLALDAGLLRSLSPLEKKEHDRPVMPILLPHAGELADLLETDATSIAAAPVKAGHRAAQLYCSIVLVKGVTSHIVHPDGRAWTYDGGAPGLGVSGSGDALAGIVGGLLSRGAEPLAALLWGVWLHGEAGAALAKTIGPIGFLAREIADQVPALLPR